MQIQDQLSRAVCLIGKKKPIAALIINHSAYDHLKKWAGECGVGGGRAKWTHFIGIPLEVSSEVWPDELCVMRFEGCKAIRVAFESENAQ